MIKFKEDFNYFWDKIEKGENFTFSRYADGEVMLMNGKLVDETTQAFRIDKWKSPEKITKVSINLFETLNHTEENYYYAISSKSDNLNDYDFLKKNIKQNNEKITFVNLWINANYNDMKLKLQTLKRDVILICNHKAKKQNFPFNVKDLTPFPDDCINFWENNGDNYINFLVEKYKDFKNELFFISCGPISEIIIHHLYLNNQNNTYIDVGSSIDEFVHGFNTRPYMDERSIYNKMISNF